MPRCRCSSCCAELGASGGGAAAAAAAAADADAAADATAAAAAARPLPRPPPPLCARLSRELSATSGVEAEAAEATLAGRLRVTTAASPPEVAAEEEEAEDAEAEEKWAGAAGTPPLKADDMRRADACGCCLATKASLWWRASTEPGALRARAPRASTRRRLARVQPCAKATGVSRQPLGEIRELTTEPRSTAHVDWRLV